MGAHFFSPQGLFAGSIGFFADDGVLGIDVTCMPVSALTGQGLKNRIDPKLCSWYNGPSLLEFLDNMQGLERKVKAPFMMPVNGKYKVGQSHFFVVYSYNTNWCT